MVGRPRPSAHAILSQAGFDGDLDSRMLSWGEEILRVMSRPSKYPKELIERGVRLALESERPIAHVAADLGIHPETLRKRVRQAEADSGSRTDLLTTQEREEIRKLRRANEILKAASVFFAKELDQDRPR